jgi:MFS family permease
MISHLRDFIGHRYSWKAIKESDLTELYVSMTIKTLGLSLIGIFLPIYLYENGLSLLQIALFYVMTYGMRAAIDYPVTKIIARFGPKHVMTVANMLLAVFLIFLVTYPVFEWSLPVLAVFDALAASLFFTAYHIEFSKIQHAKSAGHELGLMFQLSKIAGVLGPVIGGLIAYFSDIRVAIVAAIAMIFASGIPLLASKEAVRVRQKLTFKGFAWGKVKRDALSNAGLGFDQVSALMVWPLFIALFLVGESVYLGVGVITSLGLLVSLLATRAYGKYIDKGKGHQVLKLGALITAGIGALRPLVGSFGGAVGLSMANDPASLSVRMAYTKGQYGKSSDMHGYRDVYWGYMMFVSNLARMLFWAVLAVLAYLLAEKAALQIGLFVGALAGLLVLVSRFKY